MKDSMKTIISELENMGKFKLGNALREINIITSDPSMVQITKNTFSLKHLPSTVQKDILSSIYCYNSGVVKFGKTSFILFKGYMSADTKAIPIWSAYGYFDKKGKVVIVIFSGNIKWSLS